MQRALALDPEERQPGPELVTTPATAPEQPEQLPLIRMLEVVRDRVESIHAGQKAVMEDLRDVKANLPMQRRAVSKRTEAIHVLAVWTRRNGLCPCCQEVQVVDEFQRLPGSEIDHWLNRANNRPNAVWIVCGPCNRKLVNAEFKATAQPAFASFQAALKPLLTNRQIPISW